MTARTDRSFTEGGMFVKMLLFALPIMTTSVLQILYNVIGSLIVGQFSGDPNALAAIGCTGPITGLILNLLVGLSSGAGVIIAQRYGAGDESAVRRTVHTAMTTAVIGGVLMMLVGIGVANPIVSLIVQEELRSRAVLYVTIIFFGVPATSIFNFGASILRSVGESRTPLIILLSSGLLNVGLNLLFVIVFKMTVNGAALATVFSQYASAVAVVAVLATKKTCFALSFKELKIEKSILLRILMLGIPAGLQSAAYNVANMSITGAVNTFPRVYVSAAAICMSTLDSVIYASMNCFMHVAMTFAGQNYGANKKDRVNKSLIYAIIQIILAAGSVCAVIYIFRDPIAALFVDPNDSERLEVLSLSSRWLAFTVPFYIVLGVSEVCAGFLRGLGYSVSPTVMNLIGVFAVRLIWTQLVFPNMAKDIFNLIACYPVSWFAAFILQGSLVIFHLIKEWIKAKRKPESKEEKAPHLR